MSMKIVVLAATLTDSLNQVEVSQRSLSSIETPVGAVLLDAASLVIGADSYLVTYFKGEAVAPLVKISDNGNQATLTAEANLQIGDKFDLIESFVLGNNPYLLAYRRDKGIFNFFPVESNLTCPTTYRFFRNHDPGITAGFTTVKLFTAQSGMAYLGYNQQTGNTAIYTLSVTSTSPTGVAPLLSLCVWSHQWAPGWTRFAFFQWGGGNFFLKTNTAKPNVNIDHVLDNLADGMVEVGNLLDLTDAQQLSIVEPFTMVQGDPYFLTYRPDGHITLNRFHGDGKSWTTVGEFDAPPGVTQIVPIQLSNAQLFVLCITDS
jgi:hypothetical protein